MKRELLAKPAMATRRDSRGFFAVQQPHFHLRRARCDRRSFAEGIAAMELNAQLVINPRRLRSLPAWRARRQ